MKNRELLQIWDTINQHYNEITSIKSTKFAYALGKNSRIIQFEAKEIYEARDKLYPESLSEINKKLQGEELTQEMKIQLLKQSEPDFEKFGKSKEFQELMDFDAKIEIYKIKIHDLPADLTAAILQKINWMIED